MLVASFYINFLTESLSISPFEPDTIFLFVPFPKLEHPSFVAQV